MLLGLSRCGGSFLQGSEAVMEKVRQNPTVFSVHTEKFGGFFKEGKIYRTGHVHFFVCLGFFCFFSCLSSQLSPVPVQWGSESPRPCGRWERVVMCVGILGKVGKTACGSSGYFLWEE